MTTLTQTKTSRVDGFNVDELIDTFISHVKALKLINNNKGVNIKSVALTVSVNIEKVDPFAANTY